jgi:hypothetical protein
MADARAELITRVDGVFASLGIKPDDAGTFVDALTMDQLQELIRAVKSVGGSITLNASGNLVSSPVFADTSSN